MTTGNTQGQTAADLDSGQGLEGAPNAPKDTGRTKVEKTDDEGPGDSALTPEQIAAAAKLKAAGNEAPASEDEPDVGEQDDAEAETPEWDGEYVQLDDPAGQSVVNLLNAAGVKAKEANAFFAKALETGNPKDVDWGAIEARIGKDQANLAKIGFNDYYQRVYSKNVANKAAVLEVVGGDKNWNKMVKWAQGREGSDPAFAAELEDIRAGIAAGGKNAKRAAEDLIALYEGDSKNSGLNNRKPLEKGDKNTSKLDGEPMSRAEYFKAVKALDAEPGTPQSKAAKIKSLQARRLAGKAAGK